MKMPAFIVTAINSLKKAEDNMRNAGTALRARVVKAFAPAAPAPIAEDLATLKKRFDRWNKVMNVVSVIAIGIGLGSLVLGFSTMTMTGVGLAILMSATVLPIFGIPNHYAQRAADRYHYAKKAAAPAPTSSAPETPAATPAAPAPRARASTEEAAAPQAETSAEAASDQSEATAPAARSGPRMLEKLFKRKDREEKTPAAAVAALQKREKLWTYIYGGTALLTTLILCSAVPLGGIFLPGASILVLMSPAMAGLGVMALAVWRGTVAEKKLKALTAGEGEKDAVSPAPEEAAPQPQPAAAPTTAPAVAPAFEAAAAAEKKPSTPEAQPAPQAAAQEEPQTPTASKKDKTPMAGG